MQRNADGRFFFFCGSGIARQQLAMVFTNQLMQEWKCNAAALKCCNDEAVPEREGVLLKSNKPNRQQEYV